MQNSNLHVLYQKRTKPKWKELIIEYNRKYARNTTPQSRIELLMIVEQRRNVNFLLTPTVHVIYMYLAD